jgi:hypothetical protein
VTAQMEPRPLPFSARHYEDRLKGLPDQDGRRKGFHKGQTERLVRDLITEVVQVQTTNGLLLTERDAANDALRFHADERAAAGHPWELDGPPTMAIEAVVVGQQMAERHDRAANAEIAYRLANADRMQQELQALLDQAKATAVAPPPVLALPAEPRVEGVAASLEAQAQHLQACRAAYETYRDEHERWEADRRAELERQSEALDAHRAELADQERALADRQDGLVAEIDHLTETLPALRSVVVDLTAGESTGETAKVAS